MTLWLLIACLFAATPAFSQTKVYTNADLGRPLSPNRVSVSPEVLASLAAHQFRVPRTFDGPIVLQGGSSPTSGPFSDYQNTIIPRRLDGSPWTEPQWASITYVGRPHYGRSSYPPYASYATGPRGASHHGEGSGGRLPTAGRGASGHPSRGR